MKEAKLEMLSTFVMLTYNNNKEIYVSKSANLTKNTRGYSVRGESKKVTSYFYFKMCKN